MRAQNQLAVNLFAALAVPNVVPAATANTAAVAMEEQVPVLPASLVAVVYDAWRVCLIMSGGDHRRW